MSLINRMLQDLEARHAEPLETNSFPDKIHAVAAERPSPIRLWTLSVGVVFAVLIASWFLWRSWSNPPSALPPTLSVTTPKVALPSTPPPNTPIIMAKAPPIAPAKQASPVLAIPAVPPVSENIPIAAKELATPDTKLPDTPTLATTATPPKADKKEIPLPPKEAVVHIAKPAKELSSKQRADELYQKALGLVQQGRLDEGRAGLEEALQLNPGNLGVRQAMLGLLVEAKQYDKAVTLLQGGLAQNPQQSGFAMALARLLVERGEAGAALQTLERHQSHAQDNAEYRAFKGTLLQRENRHKEAITEYQAALRAGPQSGVWLIGLAISLEGDSQPASAKEAYRRAQQTSLSPELYAYSEQRLAKLQQDVQ